MSPDFPLSPKQADSIVEATARINAWEGSASSGKTIASLVRWLAFVANPPHTGELVMVGRTRESLARNTIGPLQDQSLFGPFASHVHYTPGAPTATIFGRTVHMLGANDAKAEPKVRGLTCAGAYVDEVTVLPESFFNQLNVRCRVAGAKLFVTTNPDNPMHWFRKNWLLRPRETGLRSWHFTLDDNPHLEPEYVKILKTTYVGLWYKRFILGEWVQAEGAIYDMWDEDLHVVRELPRIERYLGAAIDYGTTNPTVALMLGLGAEDDGTYRLYLTHEWRWDSRLTRQPLTDAQYSQRIRAWASDLGITPEWWIVDPSAASFRVQMHHDGVTSVLADNDVLGGIRLVASLLGAGLLRVHERCTGWREEIPGYSWDPDKAAKGEDAPIKRDDHDMDAGRYDIATTQALWRPQLDWLEAA